MTADRPRSFRRQHWIETALLAVVAYLPLLATQPGQVGADTKTYLTLDPARLLSRASSMWDPNIGTGTVTHQNVGYLWPLGPWYWTCEQLGLPDWVAQRLWLGTLLFAAGLGVRYLLNTLDWSDDRKRHGVFVAAFAYMLSPYLLDYSARISVILLPWAGLGWLIAFTVRSLRVQGWRYPALFALVTVTVGGINATALLMVAPGPFLWVLHATWITREVSGRDSLAALGRMATLTFATSLWWMVGLWAQGQYGLPVLRYTETYRTVAESSTPAEVLRGLGYWFFYGKDKLGPWIAPSSEYTNRTAVLALSFFLPILSIAAASVLRWTHRTYFLGILFVGALMSVAANPFFDTSPLGAVFKVFTQTDAGLALRSTPRAVPLVILSTSVFLGAGLNIVSERIPARATLATGLAGLLIALNIMPLWTGKMIDDNLKRPEDIPSYWQEATSYLDAQSHATRILEVPGTDFAAYRWGNTVDPITPGLLDRPYLARELFPYGSAESTALLIAYDRAFHEHLMDPDAVAPIARLFSAGDLVLRADLQYERFRVARPVPTFEILNRSSGLGDPIGFGSPEPNVAGPIQFLVDEISLTEPPELPDPWPVTVYPIEDPLPILHTRPLSDPFVLSGDQAGLVDAAGQGLLPADQAVFLSPSFAGDPAGLDLLLENGADLVITDTNRVQARRWGTTQQNTGYTEQLGEIPDPNDPTDQRLELFPEAQPSSSTVTDQFGPVTASATQYGNPVTYIPDDRPANAVDGDPYTAWRVGAFSDVVGESLLLEFDQPQSASSLTLVQPQIGVRNRYIRGVRLIFDENRSSAVDSALTVASEDPDGETITFDQRSFSSVRIEITATDAGQLRRYDGLSGVGLAEVIVGDPPLVMQERVVLPTDLLDHAGADSANHSLTYLLTRLRSNPAEKVRFDEEERLVRLFEVMTERSFTLRGDARLSADVDDATIDDLIALPGVPEGYPEAVSDARINGSLRHRAAAAIDGDPTTFWMPVFEKQAGHFIDFTLPEPTTLDHLNLVVVADGRHSIPSRVFIRPDGDDTRVSEANLGDVPITDIENHTETVRIDFEPQTGTTFRFAIDFTDERETVDWHSGFDVILPIGIAELGIPGAGFPKSPDAFDTGCRDDLLLLDDQPVPIRVSGSTDDALDRKALSITPCGDDLFLAPGEHLIVTPTGRTYGIDIDQLALGSDESGSAVDPLALATAPVDASPAVHVLSSTSTQSTVEIDDAGEAPFWLVLGQSLNEGWSANLRSVGNLGPPTLIDGYANGWLIDPASASGPLIVDLEWKPQRIVRVALGASALGLLLCIAALLLGRRSERESLLLDPTAPPAWHSPWTSPDDQPIHSRQRSHAAMIAVAFAVAAALVTPPPFLAAGALGGAVYAAQRLRSATRLLNLLAALSFALAGASIVVTQYVLRHPPDFAWPKEFPMAQPLALFTIFALGVDALLDSLARRRSGSNPVLGESGEPDETG